MQFLYPTSRQFPFDDVCEQIVRALHARNWQVPGFKITMSTYGSGEQKLRHVGEIVNASLDVKIRFGRQQGLLPGGAYKDVAAVHEVQIARRALDVYEDESGPSYCVYVGECWERDRTTWWQGYNAKHEGKPRTYLRYSGNGYRAPGMRAGSLEAVKDYREYMPEGAEPMLYSTDTVMAEIRDYLHDVVLTAIEAQPGAAAIADVCAEDPPLPIPPHCGPFFTYGDGRDTRRIAEGKQSLADLPLHDRYGMAGSGWRLAPLGIKSGADLPAVAFDGFLWCGATPTIPGAHSRGSYDNQLIKVTPLDARGIFVADHAVYERRRAELSAAIKGQRDRFTDAEVNDFIRARACTIVPIAEYAGTYADPVYLFNRELAFAEVEVIGPRAC